MMSCGSAADAARQTERHPRHGGGADAGTRFGHDHLRTAIAATVSHGACDVAAVRYLLTEAGLHQARPQPMMSARSPATIGRCRSRRLRHAARWPLRGDRMMSELQDQAIRQHCKALRMPTIGGQFARLADAASREGRSHVGYLEHCSTAEMEERESRAITRLLHEARLPR